MKKKTAVPDGRFLIAFEDNFILLPIPVNEIIHYFVLTNVVNINKNNNDDCNHYIGSFKAYTANETPVFRKYFISEHMADMFDLQNKLLKSIKYGYDFNNL